MNKTQFFILLEQSWKKISSEKSYKFKDELLKSLKFDQSWHDGALLKQKQK